MPPHAKPPRAAPRLVALVSAAAVLTALAGCASGWVSDTLYVAKWTPAWKGKHRQASYRVGVPGSGWSATRQDGSQVAWSRGSPPGVIQVRSQCEEHGDSGLAEFTDHLRIDFGAWTVVRQEPLALVGREALRTRVDAQLDGVPVALDLVVLKKDGCLFDLSYIAPPHSFEQGRGDFESVVAGFEFPVNRGRRK